MSSQPFIGIDYGTCNSSMAWFNPKTGQAEILLNTEGEDKTPSVVWFSPKEVVVGKYAEERLEHAEDRMRVIVAAKRELAKQRIWWIGGRTVTPVEAAAAILRKLKRDAEVLHFYKPVARAVLTHPADFDEVEKDELREAAARAGFTEVELLEEPVAAALAYAAAGVEVGRQVLVYDLGGGTFDLALLVRDEDDGAFRLAMEPRGKRIGGEDFDHAIYDYLDGKAQQRFGKPLCADGRDLHLLRQCRKYKENLSVIDKPVPLSWWMAGLGRLKWMISRKVFEELIAEHVQLTVQLTRSLWEEAVRQGQRTDSVLLIGGSSRVPLIQQRLREELQLEPRRWQKQDVAVALGAAHFARALWGESERCRPAERQPISAPRGKRLDPWWEDPRAAQPAPIPLAGGNDNGAAIYLLRDGSTQRGPYSLAELKHEEVHSLTPVWKPGLPGWVHAGELAELKPLILQARRPVERADRRAAQDQANADAIRCPGCRGQVQRGMSFCPHCGSSLSPGTASDRPRFPLKLSVRTAVSATKNKPRPDKSPTQRPGNNLVVSTSILLILGLMAAILGIILIVDSSHGYYDGYRYEYRIDKAQQGVGLFFLLSGVAGELTGFILFLLWLYQAWSLVPTEYDEPSPGMAVGLLFVPFFNLYWMFRVIPGLSNALERILRNIDSSRRYRAGYGVGCLACLFACIPYLNVISLFLFVGWMNAANHAKNRIIALRNRR